MYTYLEVCAGCGGLSYGLELSGLTPITLIEIDKKCVETLKKNFNCDIQCEDMRKIDFKKYRNKIDIVVGGIPCQSFSMAGNREGLNNKDKGGLFYDFKRCIQEIEPDMFMIENVEGLQNINNGDTLKFIISELEKENYTVTYKLLNAVNYYVPQKRKRLIIIGTKYNVQFEFPQEFNKIITLKDALKDVPDSNHIEYSDNKKKIMELIPEGGCWIDLPKDLQKEYLGKSYNSGGGKRGFARRLSWHEPSLTLTTSPCQKQTERCHPSETRPLKTREYARIQTFPDNFIFEGNTISIYKQIGNAVPPMLAYFIGLQIKKTLIKIKIQKIINNICNLHIIFDKKFENNNIYKYENNKLYNRLIMSELKELVHKYLEKEIIPLYEDIKNNTDIDKVKKAMDIRFLNIDEKEWQIKSNYILNQSKIQQKIGLMHEYIFSNLKDWMNCKNYSDERIPADIMKKDKSIFIELKNKHNTMNGGSKKTVYDNLIGIKKKFPDAMVVLGIINTKNNICYNKLNEELGIYEYGGDELFNLVYNSKSYMDDLLETIQEYTKSDKDKSDKNKSDKDKSDKNKPDKDKSDKDKSDKDKSDKDKSDKKPNKIIKKK